MRSLPVMLSLALALTAFTACDKKDDKKTEDKKADDKKADDKADEKADAKKAGDQEVSANTVDDEEGCIHDKPEEKHEGEGHSCDHGAGAPEAGATGHFGAAFALAESKPLGEVLAAGVPTEAVKVTGTVGKVCQKKGCWMVIQDGDKQARVLVKDHAFAIPMDGEGKSAVVEGTMEVKDLTEANVAHLKKDGDSSLEGDEARKEYFLHATAVELAPNA